MNLQSYHTQEVEPEADYRIIIVCLVTLGIIVLITGLVIFLTK